MNTRREYAYFAHLGLKTRVLNQLRRAFTWAPLEKFLQRRVQDKPLSAGWSKLIPPEYLYPAGSWRIVARGKHRMRLDLSNTTDHWAYFGMKEQGHVNFLHGIKTGDTVLDIGANIGLQTLDYSIAVGSTGKVVSFEPHPGTFKRLEEHLRMNSTTNVQALNMGIGPTEATLIMYEVVGSNSGMNRIINNMEEPERFPHVEVKVSPLGKALAGAGIDRINAIKIDVEGYEMAVLRGCEAELVRDKPILLIELDDANLRENDSSAAELVAFLERLGYHIRIANDGRRLPADLAHQHFDVLAAPGIQEDIS